MASVITILGEKLFAQKAQANEQLDIDTFIFANVPGQDPSAAIDRNEGVPPLAQQVHTQIVQQVGRINENSVVYSTVLDSVTGDFEFNWVGLYSSVNDTLIAINHVPTTNKTKTVQGVAGNTLNRNFSIEYSGVAELTAINVSPETWQLDFTARLSGMDELTRQLASDMNGKDWFISDGFKVVPRATVNTFDVLPGVGYVNGLRIEQEAAHILTLQTYPQFVYVDAYFDGDASSVWKPKHVFTVTDSEMNDYIDVNGKQHYVYKLATIAAADSVDDLRQDKGIAESKWIKENYRNKAESDVTYQEIRTTENSYVACKTASPLFSNTEYLPEDLNKSASLDTTAHSGLLINADQDANLDLVLPYAVIIGDSISEGHPALHGRLHPAFDASYKSQPGQLSYELSKKFGIPFINHGIGGQTTVNIRNRWLRDVLHLVNNPGDGLGDSTMNFANQLPYLVYLHVGVNDVFQGVDTPTIKDNFRYFAQSCKDNNITLILDNIGVELNYDQIKESQAIEINNWLTDELLTEFPEIQVIDYLDWSSDGTKNYTNLKAGMFADSVHPSKSGYADFASYICKNIKKEVFLSSMTFNSRINGNSRFSRVTKFKFNGKLYNVSGDSSTIKLNNLNNGDDPIVSLTPIDYELVTGNGSNQYTGFAQIYCEFSNQPIENSVVPESSEFNGGVVAAAVVLNGVISDSYKNIAIASINDSDLANGALTINFDELVTHMSVEMVGTSGDSHNFKPRWTSGAAINGSKVWNINLHRISDGVAANNVAYHNYQILGYRLY